MKPMTEITPLQTIRAAREIFYLSCDSTQGHNYSSHDIPGLVNNVERTSQLTEDTYYEREHDYDERTKSGLCIV